MAPMRLERERPSEWLRWLSEEPHAYQVLVSYAGGMARAAYRLANARCRLRGIGEVPTLAELQAAALVISRALGKDESLPITSAPPPRLVSSRPPLRRAS